MELDSAQARQIAQELDMLLGGAHLNKVQELEKNCLKIKLHTKQGTKELVIAPNAVYLTRYRLKAKENPGGFGAYLKKQLYNKRIEKVWQHSVDRIIVIEFKEHYLVCELFGQGNTILCSKDWSIMQPLRREEWKGRKLWKGEKYSFPQNLAKEKEKELEEKISKAKPNPMLMEKTDEHFSESMEKNEEEEKKVERRKKGLEHSRKQQEEAKKKFQEQAEKNKKKGEKIYENYSEIKEILETVKEARKKGYSEKEIEKRLLEARKQGKGASRLIKSVGLKQKKIVLEL